MAELKIKIEEEMIRNTPTVRACEAWWRLTNALISKYKKMADESPKMAIEQIKLMSEMLVYNGFLSQKELDNGL